MDRIAIYPGSFNPWHKAHQHVLDKALKVFDKVIVARGVNGNKPPSTQPFPEYLYSYCPNVEVTEFKGFLADFAKKQGAIAIIRGLRNVFDFYEEKDNQYWHEDLGLAVPIFYIISDRNLAHISSKAVRIIDSFKLDSLSDSNKEGE